jgi:hypothetical protein
MANNIFTFQKNVTTHGTPVQLTAQTVDPDQTVLVKAKAGNTGSITVGYTSASALNSGTGWFKLAAGQAIELKVTDTSKIWIDSTVDGEGVEVFVGASGSPALSSSGAAGGATEATLTTRLSESDFDTKVGSVTEAAPASDTASSGLNGRLQRIAQRLTSLIAATINVALYAPDGTALTQSGGKLLVNVQNFGIGSFSNQDANAANTTSALVMNQEQIFNGTTWDRKRGNTEVTLLASGARTTTQTGADQTNYNAKGIVVVLDMTTVGTGSVTLEIQAKDPVSGKYYAVLTGAAVTTNSTNVYKVHPGLTAAANAVANDMLPRTYRVVVTANNANSATYSVGAMLIV